MLKGNTQEGEARLCNKRVQPLSLWKLQSPYMHPRCYNYSPSKVDLECSERTQLNWKMFDWEKQTVAE